MEYRYLYISIIAITELLMTTMIIHVVRYAGFNKTQKFWYILTFSSIMVCALCELLVHGITYKPAYEIPLSIATVIQFSLAPMLGLFFTGALGLHKQARISSYIYAGVNLVTEVVLACLKLSFYFDNAAEAGNEFTRGNAFPVYVVFFSLSLLYLIVSMVIVGKRFNRRDLFTIIMVIVILVAGIIPMFFHINVTYVAIAICSTLCYIYYNDLVQQDTQKEFADNQKKITSMQEHIISGLSNLIENRDMETGEHILRTGAYVRLLAEFAKKEGIYEDQLTDRFITLLCTLAPMHDIGKIVVSDKILKKPGKLTAEEFELMKQHAAVGGRVVREVLNDIAEEEYISFASDISTYHHEKWDGTGYPKGLKGEEIPLSARIMAFADVFDALVSERCYKDPIPFDEAIDIMVEEKGTHFDPKLMEVFLKYKEDFIKASTFNRPKDN